MMTRAGDIDKPQDAQGAVFCRHCLYSLKGLSDARCPECGRPFDPDDARTFLDAQRLARRRRRKRALLASALVIPVLAGLITYYVGRSHYERRRMKYGCTVCGARRVDDEIWVGRLRLLRRTRGVDDNEFSKFMSQDVGEHEHSWSLCLGDRYDWNGSARFPRITGDSQMGLVFWDFWRAKKLNDLAERVPDLRRMIREDILAPTSEHAFTCEFLLVKMCADRSKASVRRALFQWQLTRYWEQSGKRRAKEEKE